MDISEQYFDMCEQAYKYLGVPNKSVSESVPCCLPNLWHMPNPGTDRWVGKHRMAIGDWENEKGTFPVYRFDQLQEMSDSLDALAFLNEFRQYWVTRTDKNFSSTEELLLEYVMWCKYGRRWQKGQWVSV